MNFAGENVIEACACGRDEVIERCCLPYIEGRAKPDSAEALMRARYTAYTRRTVDFIVASHDPARRSELDVEAIKRWAEQSEWLQLEILQAQQGAAGDKSGTVEFRVHYRLHGATHVLHEISHFIHKQGQWFYKEGEHPTLKPVIRTGTKVGRNDPCPCGSGKKHKKCCMTEEVINVS